MCGSIYLAYPEFVKVGILRESDIPQKSGKRISNRHVAKIRRGGGIIQGENGCTYVGGFHGHNGCL